MSEPVEILKNGRSIHRNAPIDVEYGKLPPQARELEEVVLGAIMTESNAIQEVVNIIHPDCFYVDAHQRIYKAIINLYASQSAIDMLTVISELRRLGDLDASGGPYYITGLTNKVGSSAHIVTHAMIIKEAYIKRTMIGACTNCIREMYDDSSDAFDTMAVLMSDLDRVNSEVLKLQQDTFSDIVAGRILELKKAADENNYRTGEIVYLDDLDRHTNGFQPSDLIIMAGRPSMGKTAAAIDFARNQAKHGIPVGFFSLEMNSKKIVDRIIASEISADLQSVGRGGLKGHEWQRLDDCTVQIMEYPIYMYDKGGLDINRLCAIAKTWHLKHKIRVLYIDYLQLITVPEMKKNSNREQEISTISRRLKGLAMELQIPVIALSQLSRAVEQRADKEPMLSDLRESGALEQDADMVIFPFRPGYYDDKAEQDLCKFIVAKYRNGKTGFIDVNFNLSTQRFSNYEAPF